MKVCYAADPFIAAGFRRRVFFPHEVIVLRKAYPDTFVQMEKRGIAAAQRAGFQPLQVNLYSNRIEDLPADLFIDPVVNWHQQQFGRAGLIASAGLFLRGDALFVSLLQSDLCQQIAKNRRLHEICASRLNNRFRYWYEVLFNAILDLAIDLNVAQVYSPTAEQIVGTTVKAINPALFNQVYDFCQSRYEVSHEVVGSAKYWCLSVAGNADKIVRLESAATGTAPPVPQCTICVYHDIEENVDTEVEPNDCHEAFIRMLEVERRHEVTTTYNVLGQIFPRKSELIGAQGGGAQSIGFHTYNHCHDALDQLPRLRNVDLQVKGYRTAKSIITEELTDEALSFYNFEWLMSSAHSYGFDLPRLENGIVKIPASIDDYPLKTGELSYEQWFDRIVAIARRQGFVAVGLHDCYARFWIENYSDLLERLKRIGEFRTCDQITNLVYLFDSSRMSAKAPSVLTQLA
jgi:hypothetical protein